MPQVNDELQQRVNERTVELTMANQKLVQKFHENEMFVHGVSHDLRSPLVNLQGFSNELALTCHEIRKIFADSEMPGPLRQRVLALLDGDATESIHYIQSAVTRVSNIIDALLRLSRAGSVEYQRQAVDLSAVVGRIVESMAGTIAERGATVAVKNLQVIWGDPTALERLFANLIGNAVNYLDPKRPGLIEVGCAASQADHFGEGAAMHTVYVKDNGLGIPETWSGKVFQAFQRLHPETTKGEGIGLAIVQRIVGRHGGSVWFESTVGKGTTFFVSLAAAPEQPTRNWFSQFGPMRSGLKLRQQTA